MTEYLDLEPFMTDLCLAILSTKTAEIFMPACRVYDLVRRAQKAGVKECKFIFNDDGTTTFNDGLPEKNND